MGSVTSNNMKLVYWPLMVTFGTAKRGMGGPLLAITAHPSTANVGPIPIIVLLYNGTLLCGFNMPVKGFFLLQ